MKKLLIPLILILTVSVSFAQNSNEERISKLEEEIQVAVENQDYKKAEKLKKEKETRQEIQKAVEEGDYEKAKELKESLNNDTEQASNNSGSSNKVRIEESAPAESTSYESNNDTYSSNSGADYFFDNGIYLEAGIIGSTTQSFSGAPIGSRSMLSIFEIRFGSRFYFDGMKFGNFALGLDAKWVDILPRVDLTEGSSGNASAEFGLAHPGVIFTYAFNEKIAVEAYTNFGFTFQYTNIWDEYYDEQVNGVLVGFAVTPGVRFRYRKLSAGFNIYVSQLAGQLETDEYYATTNGYTTYPSVTLSSTSFNFVVGFKF